MSRSATYPEMILFAKQRVVKALGETLCKEYAEVNYCYERMHPVRREKFLKKLVIYTKLLELPLKRWSLKILKRYGFWKGIKDDFWHNIPTPKGYRGE